MSGESVWCWNERLAILRQWCDDVLGDWELAGDDSKEHMGHDSGVYRLRSGQGNCYLKVHDDAAHWACEVHGYEVLGAGIRRAGAAADRP